MTVREQNGTATNEDVQAYLDEVRNAPRITSLLSEFSDLATGRKGAPDYPIAFDPSLLGHDALSLQFAEVRDRHAGVFNQHFVTSLPYVLEEQCRLGAAMVRYGEHLSAQANRPLDVYTLGDASGVTARSLAEFGEGRIRTLTCSPNAENEAAFMAGRPNGHAHFFLGPFFEVTADSLAQRGISDFQNGFDIVIEDTTFQMYGRSRLVPIQLAARNLRDDGIFIMLEKFNQTDHSEFLRRERQKDDDFKALFYSQEKIEQKRQTIVNNMDNQLVTLEEFTATLKRLFSSAVVFWNTGNFYTIAASNDAENLQRFVAGLIPAPIPDAFRYIDLPHVLFGEPGFAPTFRQPEPQPA